jgi:hypothetical protein
MKCEKSYSGEHAFIPTEPENSYCMNKCVLCEEKQVVNEDKLMKKVNKNAIQI